VYLTLSAHSVCIVWTLVDNHAAGHAWKFVSDVTSVGRLCDDIVNKFNAELPQEFIMHYYDDDFGDYFTLDCDENIEEKMTIKIVASAADTAANAASPDRNDETPSPAECVARKGGYDDIQDMAYPPR